MPAVDTHLVDITADNLRRGRSKDLINIATGDYNVFRLPRYAFVHNIILHILVAYGLTTTMTVGFTGNREADDLDAFMLSVDIDPDGPTKTRSMVNDGTGIWAGGKWFDAGPGMIVLSHVKGNAGATASARFFIDYTVIY